MNNKFLTINCPHCGYEYTLAELFIPQQLIGEPQHIQRENGKIIKVYGEPPLLVEKYICDNCNKSFSIQCDISFKSSFDNEINFDDDYSVEVKHKLSLKEF